MTTCCSLRPSISKASCRVFLGCARRNQHHLIHYPGRPTNRFFDFVCLRECGSNHLFTCIDSIVSQLRLWTVDDIFPRIRCEPLGHAEFGRYGPWTHHRCDLHDSLAQHRRLAIYLQATLRRRDASLGGSLLDTSVSILRRECLIFVA